MSNERTMHKALFSGKAVLCAAVVIPTLVCVASVEAVLVFSEKKEGGFTQTTVTNSFFSVVFTTSGGRIKSLVNEQSGRELTAWRAGKGGALHDGAAAAAVYDYDLPDSDKSKTVLKYSHTDDKGLCLEKIITIVGGLPKIAVAYTLTNKSDSSMEYEHIVGNYLIPAAGKPSEAICFLHTADSIRTHRWGTYGKASFTELVGSWVGLVDQASNNGIAIVFDRIGTLTFTDQPAGLQWSWPKAMLSPGASIRYEATMVLTTDMPGFTNISDDYLFNLTYSEDSKQFQFTNTIKGISEKLRTGHITLQTRLMDINRKPLTDLAEQQLAVEINRPQSVLLSWKAPADGIYIIQQDILLGQNKLGGYEMPIVAGFVTDSSGTYRHPDFPLPLDLSQFSINDDDRQRGYFLHLPAGEDKKCSITGVDLDLGREEYEYLEINCTPLVDIGEISLRFTGPNNFPGRAELFVEENYRFLSREVINVKSDRRNPAWIKFSTHNVKAGSYPFSLTFSPKDKDPVTIKINMTVWPIDRPNLENVYVSGFWAAFCCIFGEGKLYPTVRDPERMLQLWDHCNEDMADFGQNMLEIRFSSFGKTGIIDPFIKISRYQDGYLPVLDLAGWNNILDIARKHGMRHAIFRYFYTNTDWYPPNYKELSTEQQRQIDFSILRQLIDHLKSRGFERIFWYNIDEIQPYAREIDPACEKMVQHRQLFPKLEFAGSGFGHIPLHESHGGDWRGMQDLAQHLTWIAPYWGAHSIYKWIQTGEMKLLPGTIVGTQVTGDHKESYISKRRTLWELWLVGGTGYQIYGYHTFYPEDKYSPVFSGPDRPVHSPAFAALVDGHDDFQYLHLCNRVLADLKTAGKKEKAQQFQTALDSIAGQENSLLKLKLTPPVGYDPGRTPNLHVTGDETAIRQARRRIMQLLTAEHITHQPSERGETMKPEPPA